MSADKAHLASGMERERRLGAKLVLVLVLVQYYYYHFGLLLLLLLLRSNCKNVCAWSLHDFAFTLGYGITLKKSQNSLPLTV